MNVSDKLQLIRALEERETLVRRRSAVFAWASVGLAALVLAAMILAGSYQLARVNDRLTSARMDLALKQKELAAAEERLVVVRAETEEALRNLQKLELQGVKLGSGNQQAVASAVDNLQAASVAAAPRQGSSSSGSDTRTDVIRQLFDPTPGVRIRAYSALLPRYANDPTMVPEILSIAREHPEDANGTYNALVVLSHMNATSLRPHRAEIIAFAEESQRIGPRVAERARILIRRVPS